MKSILESLKLANNLYDKGEFKKSIAIYMEHAASGDVNCARRVGWMYVFGEGVEVNDQEALKWFSIAADNNDEESLFGIGYVYLMREDREWEKAYEFFFRSAELDFAPAIFRLAWIHQYCDKYSTEHVERYLIKASSLGNIRASRDLGLYRMRVGSNVFVRFRGLIEVVAASLLWLYCFARDEKDPRLLV